MYKVLVFLKRNPAMTFEEFQTYYETKHAPLGIRAMGPDLRRYVRRYVKSEPLLFSGPVPQMEFDVVTESWFDDRAAFNRVVATLSAPETAAAIIADEQILFDRSKTQMVTVDERESSLDSQQRPA